MYFNELLRVSCHMRLDLSFNTKKTFNIVFLHAENILVKNQIYQSNGHYTPQLFFTSNQNSPSDNLCNILDTKKFQFSQKNIVPKCISFRRSKKNFIFVISRPLLLRH